MTLNLDTLDLKAGGHRDPNDGLCLLEAVAYFAGEPHSDRPTCVSPVLRRYGIALNDRLPQDRRQELKTLIPALVGTATDGLDPQRQQLASQVLMTEWLPQWLRLAKLDDLAVQAEQSAGLTGPDLTRALRAIRDLTRKAREASREQLRVRIQAEIEKCGLPADADAAADAVAVAVADAVAVAVAVADAVADAVAVAVAVAVADAAADAVAVADAELAKVTPYSTEWYAIRNKIYDAAYARVREQYQTSDTFAAVRALRDEQLEASVSLFKRLIHVGAEVPA